MSSDGGRAPSSCSSCLGWYRPRTPFRLDLLEHRGRGSVARLDRDDLAEQRFGLADVAAVQEERGEVHGLRDGALAIARFDQDVAQARANFDRARIDLERDVQRLDGLRKQPELAERIGVDDGLSRVGARVERAGPYTSSAASMCSSTDDDVGCARHRPAATSEAARSR